MKKEQLDLITHRLFILATHEHQMTWQSTGEEKSLEGAKDACVFDCVKTNHLRDGLPELDYTQKSNSIIQVIEQVQIMQVGEKCRQSPWASSYWGLHKINWRVAYEFKKRSP